MITPVQSGKSATIQYQGTTYNRHMVQTCLVVPDTDLCAEIINTCGDFLQDDDIVCIAESIIAIVQQRAYNISDIHAGWTARLLSRFVTKTPAGIGLGMPETMQMAVAEIGLLRLWLAVVVSAVTRLFGRRGDFYRIAGESVRGIDGPTAGTLPPYNEYVTLVPHEPRQFALGVEQSIHQHTGLSVQVIVTDANDLGVNILGAVDHHQTALGEALCADNPMGQGHEQTPVMICRKIGYNENI